MSALVMWGLQVFLPLWLGGCIYILFRSNTLLMFQWFKWIGIGSTLNHLRMLVHPVHALLPEWFVFSLPTALYTFSIINFAWFMQMPNLRRAWLWTLILSIGAVGVELAQIWIPVAGTFSAQDLVLDLIALLASQPFAQLLVRRINALA